MYDNNTSAGFFSGARATLYVATKLGNTPLLSSWLLCKKHKTSLRNVLHCALIAVLCNPSHAICHFSPCYPPKPCFSRPAEVERLERAGRATSGPGRDDVMQSIYGRLDPKPKGAKKRWKREITIRWAGGKKEERRYKYRL